MRHAFDPQTCKAIAAASFTPTAAATIFMSLYMVGNSDGGSIRETLDAVMFGIFMTLVIGFIFSAASCVLIGIHVYLLLRHFHLNSVWWYAAVSSAMTFGFAVFGSDFSKASTFDFVLLASLAFGGPIAAITFWWIARPDQKLPRPLKYTESEISAALRFDRDESFRN